MPIGYSPGGITALDVWDVLVAAILTPGSVGESIADILADVTGIAGAAMRGTDNAFLAASAGLQMSAYQYNAGLASGTTFVPAQGTVITVSVLESVADNDYHIVHTTTSVGKIGRVIDTYEQNGSQGFIYCDGTNVGIRNADAVQRTLRIEGLTLA